MFLCQECKSKVEQYQCECGYEINFVDGIMQLTDLPNLLIEEDEEDKYIGYEHIGEHYSGYEGTVVIDDQYMIAAEKIKELIGVGVLLDLGCGDGFYAIPLVMNQVKVIAGDISNRMLHILQEKLDKLRLDKSLITLVRMNAYDIPLADNSVDAVIANSMLHLNSNPKKIINEIYRALKDGGIYFCFDDAPNQTNIGDEFDNSEYNDRLEFHNRYFKYLNEMGIRPRRYSWKFDRDSYCKKLFKESEDIALNLPKKICKTTFNDGFHKRMKARGFSDQTAVSEDVHKIIFDKVDQEMIEKYGPDYREAIFTYYSSDVVMKIYKK